MTHDEAKQIADAAWNEAVAAAPPLPGSEAFNNSVEGYYLKRLDHYCFVAG